MRPVAGMHPAAAQRLGGQLRLIPVAEHDARTAHEDLADLARGHQLAVRACDRDLGDGQRLARTTMAAGLPVCAAVIVGG